MRFPRSRLADVALALAVVSALVGLAHRWRGVELVGSVRVVDGDTLDLDGRRIRLLGMDAPEMAQTCERRGVAYPCGDEARAALRAMIDGPVSCRATGRDRYRRELATCSSGDRDLGREMVLRGLAVAFGRYDAEEREAREAARGVWAGPFVRPAEWRRQHAPDQGRPTDTR